MFRFFFLILLLPAFLFGTSTALFWTYATTDVVDTGKGIFMVNNLFKVYNNERVNVDSPYGARIPYAMLPTDIGLEVGIFNCGKVSAEAGIDYYPGTPDPLFFNIKFAVPENKFHCGSPSFSVALLEIGITNETAYNILGFTVGKTLPCYIGGRLFLGGYVGRSIIGEDRGGWWVGYARPFYKKKDCKGNEFYRWYFLADYASGRNVIGGGSIGLAYYITKDINFITGPTWFNSAKIYGPWKWALYINVIFPITRASLSKGC